MVVPAFTADAVSVVGVTLKPEPETDTVTDLVRLVPLTVMVLLTPLPVLVPTLMVEPLTGEVKVGVVVPLGFHT